MSRTTCSAPPAPADNNVGEFGIWKQQNNVAEYELKRRHKAHI